MEISKKQKQKATQITNDILFRIKNMFVQHRSKVERMNQDKKYGGGHMKNDISNSFYSKLNARIQQLKSLAKRVKGTEKLRKQRAQLFETKILLCSQSLQMLLRKKNIKIKINDHVNNLIDQTQKVIEQANRNLRAYQKQASQLCGKSYDVKPALERSMMEIAQYGKIWACIDRFESVTNDSVKQIYYPVEYDETVFKDIQNQIIRLWPAPIIVQKNVKVPEIIKSDNHLQQAHQLLLGLARPQQIQQAIKIYKAQAEKLNCHPTSLNVLGQLYEQGKNVNKDIKKAFYFYMKSAKMNDPQGLYKIGKFLEKGYISSKDQFNGLYPNRQSQIRGGIQYYQKAAKMGHLDAITDLGYIYQQGIRSQDQLNGYYIQPHPQYALKYYTKAKQSDFPRALNNLGALYIRCHQLPQEVNGSNLQKGIKYLQKAVKFRYLKSFINLGKCFENGVGVVQNLDRARALFLQGADLGDIQCKMEYIKSYLGSSLDQQKTMIKLVQTTRQVLLVDKYNAEAMYYMGLFLQKGIGIQKNKQSSFYYIQSSARLQYAPALTKLGDYYYSGYHVGKNIQFAKSLYQKAAKKNQSQALVNLGVLIEKGLDHSQQDPNHAQFYYQQAAKMGNTNALLLLGLNQHHNQNNRFGSNNMVQAAAQKGNINALKLLANTKNHIIPKKIRQKTTYDDAIKKMTTMSSNYMKKATMRDNFV